MPPTSTIKVLMVCTGNICRSPLAECVLRHKAVQRGVKDRLHIDSAGVGDWHAGDAPDHRVREVAAVRGVPITGAARQVSRNDLRHFDLLVCMDQTHREHLLALGADVAKTHLLLRFNPAARTEDVPDPYYGGREGFVAVFDMIDAACEHLLEHILARDACKP
jgi:protein-tyrosine phosphatase